MNDISAVISRMQFARIRLPFIALAALMAAIIVLSFYMTAKEIKKQGGKRDD